MKVIMFLILTLILCSCSVSPKQTDLKELEVKHGQPTGGYINTHAVPDAYYIVYVDSSRKLTEVKVTKGTYDYFCRFRIK